MCTCAQVVLLQDHELLLWLGTTLAHSSMSLLHNVTDNSLLHNVTENISKKSAETRTKNHYKQKEMYSGSLRTGSIAFEAIL